MTETSDVNVQPAPPQPVPEKKLRHTEWIGLIAFVVFLMVVGTLNFGMAPVIAVYNMAESHVHPNWTSLLGVGAFILATLILLPRWSIVKKFPSMSKILTLVGIVGLMAHTGMALLHPLPSALVTKDMMDPQLHAQRLLMTGPETWEIDHRPWHINSTCYIKLPDDQGVQYTLDMAYKLPADVKSMPQDELIKIVRPLILHSYQSGDYLRCVKAGRPELTPTRIAVGLVEKDGKQYRFIRGAMTIEQIKWLLAAQSTTSVPNNPAQSQPAQ